MLVDTKRLSFLTEDGIRMVENVRNAKFVATTSTTPHSAVSALLFYQEEPYPETGSHYFLLYQDPYQDITSSRTPIMVANGEEASKRKFIAAKRGQELVYSVHRHDMIDVDKGFLDGGSTYLRVGGDVETHVYCVKEDKLVPWEPKKFYTTFKNVENGSTVTLDEHDAEFISIMHNPDWKWVSSYLG